MDSAETKTADAVSVMSLIIPADVAQMQKTIPVEIAEAIPAGTAETIPVERTEMILAEKGALVPLPPEAPVAVRKRIINMRGAFCMMQSAFFYGYKIIENGNRLNLDELIVQC